MEKRIPHRALVSLNVFVYEEDPEGLLTPGVKYHRKFTLVAKGSSESECVNNVLSNVKETHKLWTKKLETN